MKYEIKGLDPAGNLIVEFSDPNVDIPADRRTQHLGGLDMTDQETLKAQLEEQTRAFISGLKQEEAEAPEPTVPDAVKALQGKVQTVTEQPQEA